MGVEHVNLNLLVPLDVLLRERNVTRAGQRLSLSQSTMSDNLGRLRKLLGDPLLVRSGRELVLTPYAESLVDPLRDALAIIDQLMTQRPTFDPKADRRTFTIIASDYVALVILRPLLEELAAEAPAVTVNLHPLRDDSPRRLRRDEVDFLLVSEGIAHDFLDEFPWEQLFEDRFLLCAWEGNANVEDAMTVAEFESLPYAQYGTGQLAGLADRALDELGVRRRVEIRTESQLVIPYLLRGTALVALVPERLAMAAQDAAELKLIEPPMPLPPIRQACAWHARRGVDAAHVWFRNRLLSLGRSL